MLVRDTDAVEEGTLPTPIMIVPPGIEIVCSWIFLDCFLSFIIHFTTRMQLLCWVIQENDIIFPIRTCSSAG